VYLAGRKIDVDVDVTLINYDMIYYPISDPPHL
jgi:hypothetical protein